MGHGIAQVAAMAGFEVSMRDIAQDSVDTGLAKVKANLEKGVARGKVSEDLKDATIARLSGTTDMMSSVADAGLVIEAAPRVT